MEIGIKQIFALFLVLVTLGAITTSITYIFFWILFRIYRWLYKHTWFSKKVVQTQSGIRKFWNKYLPQDFYLRIHSPLFTSLFLK